MADQNPFHSSNHPQKSSQGQSSPMQQSSPYKYHAQPGQRTPERFGSTTPRAHSPLPSLNLPPIRTVGTPQLSQHLHQELSPHQSPLLHSQPTPIHPPLGASALNDPSLSYYGQTEHSLHPPVGPATSHQDLRYAGSAQGQDPRMMTPGRHKKDIKRRTKTGCLTCRRRRIKCDEGHPNCRNCVKSKRECLGYDPIFKQQLGPHQLQPSPGSVSPGPSTPGHSHAQLSVGPTGYHISGGSGASSVAASTASSNSYHRSMQPGFDSTPPIPFPMSDEPVVKVRTVPIEELFSIGGDVPPYAPASGPMEPETYDNMKLVFTRDYALGLDKFLETSRFSSIGLHRLMCNKRICEMFGELMSWVSACETLEYDRQRHTSSLEARLVWNLMTLFRTPVGDAPKEGEPEEPVKPSIEDDDPRIAEVKYRVDVLECLLTNKILTTPPVPVPPPETLSSEKYYELEFWRHLASFVSHDPNSSEASKHAQASLALMRNVLNQLENRDVLYSMAVARHYGLRIPDFPSSTLHSHNNNDSDPRTKLVIAKRFIEHEANGKATSPVIRRICAMAVRSWTQMRA